MGATATRKAAELYERASALQRAGDLPEAAKLYRQVIAHDENHFEAHVNLGVALQGLGMLELARSQYERALAIVPDHAWAHCNFGTALLEEGDLDRARLHFQRALELQPRTGRFHRYAVEVCAGRVEEQHLRQMEALFGDLDPSATSDRIDLHFALAKAYANAGDHRRSFAHLREGNALKRSTILYDEAETLRVLETLPTIFGRDLVRTMAGAGDPSRTPIFIFGMPRAGTTLVEQILAAHPEIHAAGELRFFEHAFRSFSPVTGDPANVYDFAISLKKELRALGARYARELEALSASSPRVTDKNPLNFRFAGIIHLALPNARMIHIRRDPFDTCFSCFSALFNEDLNFAYDLAELGRYYRGYERLMAHWRDVLPDGALLEVHYEDVVDDLERQARRIVAFCGLEWNDACIDFSSVKRPVRTASAVAVRQPLYRSAVGRAGPYRAELEPLRRELAV